MKHSVVVTVISSVDHKPEKVEAYCLSCEWTNFGDADGMIASAAAHEAGRE